MNVGLQIPTLNLHNGHHSKAKSGRSCHKLANNCRHSQMHSVSAKYLTTRSKDNKPYKHSGRSAHKAVYSTNGSALGSPLSKQVDGMNMNYLDHYLDYPPEIGYKNHQIGYYGYPFNQKCGYHCCNCSSADLKIRNVQIINQYYNPSWKPAQKDVKNDRKYNENATNTSRNIYKQDMSSQTYQMRLKNAQGQAKQFSDAYTNNKYDQHKNYEVQIKQINNISQQYKKGQQLHNIDQQQGRKTNKNDQPNQTSPPLVSFPLGNPTNLGTIAKPPSPSPIASPIKPEVADPDYKKTLSEAILDQILSSGEHSLSDSHSAIRPLQEDSRQANESNVNDYNQYQQKYNGDRKYTQVIIGKMKKTTQIKQNKTVNVSNLHKKETYYYNSNDENAQNTVGDRRINSQKQEEYNNIRSKYSPQPQRNLQRQSTVNIVVNQNNPQLAAIKERKRERDRQQQLQIIREKQRERQREWERQIHIEREKQIERERQVLIMRQKEREKSHNFRDSVVQTNDYTYMTSNQNSRNKIVNTEIDLQWQKRLQAQRNKQKQRSRILLEKWVSTMKDDQQFRRKINQKTDQFHNIEVKFEDSSSISIDQLISSKDAYIKQSKQFLNKLNGLINEKSLTQNKAIRQSYQINLQPPPRSQSSQPRSSRSNSFTGIHHQQIGQQNLVPVRPHSVQTQKIIQGQHQIPVIQNFAPMRTDQFLRVPGSGNPMVVQPFAQTTPSMMTYQNTETNNMIEPHQNVIVSVPISTRVLNPSQPRYQMGQAHPLPQMVYETVAFRRNASNYKNYPHS